MKNRDNLLAVANSEIESIKKRIEEKTGEALKLKENIDFCGTVIKDLRKEIWECAEELKIKKNASILLENQANSLKRSNLQLKDRADSLHKQLSDTISRKSGDIMDAMIAQKRGCDVQHDRQVKTLKRTIQEMTMSSPSHGAKLKPYKDLKSPDSKKARLKSVLSYLKKEIGEDGFDGFVTDFVNYVAADPEFSFKLKLSDMDSFISTVKWKLSDGTLRDMKAFLREKLGFDIFSSRQKIHNLRKMHSGLEDYKIRVETVLKKSAGRDVEQESYVIEVKDLQSLISKRIQRLHDNGRLSFREGSSDIILGIGGDKGAAHTKLVVVFGNVDKPNDPHGILLVGLYEGHDDYGTLKEKMALVFKQLNDLEHVTYNETGKTITRSVVKLAIGDCKFLSAITGHSGQSCATPCFLCDKRWTSHGVKAQLVAQFNFFLAGSPYDPSALKEPLFHAKKGTIGVPGVHTILGIAQTYGLDWMFALCNKIDAKDPTLPENLREQRKVLKSLEEEEVHYEARYNSLKSTHNIVEHMLSVAENFDESVDDVDTNKSCGSSFCFVATSDDSKICDSDVFECSNCSKTVHNICSFIFTSTQDHQEDICCLECRKHNSNMSVQSRVAILEKIERNFRKKMENDKECLENVVSEKKILDEKMKLYNGDTRKKLEAVLKSIGCDMRAWYQQLTGNQVRNFLRPANIKKCFAIFPPNSSDNLYAMESFLMNLGKLMSSANNKVKTDEEIDDLEKVVEELVEDLKQAQPRATVTPKMHLLTCHLIPFLREHRTWGSITEQGIEHLHAVINSLHVRFASVLDTAMKATLIVKALSNYNFIFDIGASWFKAA